jgi:hypothetical protein
VLTYVVTSGVEEYEAKSSIYFPNRDLCSRAIDAIYPIIYHEFSRNSMAQCVETDLPSGSMRPKARP